MKKIILFGAIFASVLSAKSQEIEDFKLQGSQFVNDYKLVEHVMEHNHPGYTENVNNWYSQVAEVAKQDVSRGSRSTLTIPVVVHIVWKNAAENVSQYFIDEQMRILNENFQRQNADASNLRAVFNPVAGNPEINFVLAGVERVQTTSDFNFSGSTLYDVIKHTGSGGSDAWNTTAFLNIWVGKLQGDFLLGYAYPPAGAPGWPAGQNAPTQSDDGVVIDYRGFGPYTTFGGSNFKGKTTVHEVGHYLGLRHIWGDGDCSQDDGLNDTPKMGSESPQNCDANRNTCNEGAGDRPDMIENFMDYSADVCQNTFTVEQGNLMRNVLQNNRAGLLVSAGVDEFVASSLSIYPNPSNGIVNYSLAQNVDDNAMITVYNVAGNTVGNFKITNKTGSVDLSSYDNGVYIFSLKTNGSVVNKRIIVKH